jgi:malonyl-CoA/methylmalonyl-CoA synthetase
VVVALVADAGVKVDEGAIIAALKSNLAGFKVPKRVLQLDDLPRNTMAKVRKNKLRDRYRDLFPARS